VDFLEKETHVRRISFQTYRQQILIVTVLRIAHHAKLTNTWQKKG